jgi:hypothetical protein
VPRILRHAVEGSAFPVLLCELCVLCDLCVSLFLPPDR